MTDMVLPQIEIEESSPTYARIVAEPLEAGFGTTIGNALRRVLLSSLAGAAVTSVRIDQVQHEFSTIPGMKEDTIEFLLNVKELRLRGLSDRPGKMFLEAHGSGEVRASDIEVPSDYEIINPDLHLATLDSGDAHLTVEMSVERGRGYVPAGAINGLPIGVIPVDAIFTPVRRVNYTANRIAVGANTNYDRLTVEVWTDGTVSGIDAINQSAEILTEQFLPFGQLGRPQSPVSDRGLGFGSMLTPDRYNTPIEDLTLSVRAYNCLKRSGLMTVGQVLDKTEDELLNLRNFGRKSYDELKQRLVEMDFLPASALAAGPGMAGAERAAGDEDEPVAEDEANPLAAQLKSLIRQGKIDVEGQEEEA